MDDSSFNSELVQASAEYREAFRNLTSCVRRKVLQRDESPSIFNMHDTITKDGNIKLERKKLIQLFVNDGEALLKDIGPYRILVEDRSIFSSPEAADELLERLTGSWLALYFLGLPFVHLWEAVAFFAEGSGFPRGATLCKAVGDVYRGARKAYVTSSHASPVETDLSPIYVLDHNPLVMRRIILNMERSDATPTEGNVKGKKSSLSIYIAFMGMLYERLQLALYLHAGGPMRFYVPAASLKKALIGGTSRGASDAQQEFDLNVRFMWDELTFCFPAKFHERQSIQLIDDGELGYVPGCVLRPTQGIFRTREDPKKLNMGRAGNYLATRVRKEFLEKLQGIQIKEESLQQGCFDTFKARCTNLIASTASEA